MTGGDHATIGATKTTFALLAVLVDRAEPVGVTDLARAAGTTKSTAYKHLATLVDLGFVDRVDGAYAPSLRFVDFGRHAARRLDTYDRLRRYVDQLAEMTSEVAGVVLAQEGVAVDVYSAAERPDGGPYCTTRHLHGSAPGKAILAEWSDEALEAYVAGPLPALTENTLTEPDALRDEVSRVRERGLAFERAEQHPGINSVATCVPVASRDVALYVAGRADELSGKRFEENVPGILLSVARDLASDL